MTKLFEPRNLLIRADASTQIGTGHLMRCIALAQAWQVSGGVVQFVCAEIPSGLVNRLELEGCKLTKIGSKPGSNADIANTIKSAKHNEAAWVVIDGYHFGEGYQKALKDAGFRLLCIDDYGHSNHYHADLVLNQNISAEALFYQKRDPNTRLLIGVEYALIRKEFWPWRNWARTNAKNVKNILVTMGGSDPENITLKVIEALYIVNMPDVTARILVGSGNENLHALERFIENYKENLLISRGRGHSLRDSSIKNDLPKIDLIRNASDMPSQMAWSDIAVSAGGSTCWELLFMQTPTAICMVAENQVEIVEKLDSLNLIENIGGHNKATVKSIYRSIQKLCLNESYRFNLSKNCRNIVDGRGTERVLDFMKNYRKIL